ncbi:MAG: hypothetical protein A2Y62_12660, partial [Candidatus Fischerbacteria bacterium RBG_13_37_8]
MYWKLNTRSVVLLSFLVVAIAMSSLVAYGFKAKEELNSIEAKEFSAEEIYISSTQVPMEEIIGQLSNSNAWNAFLAEHKSAYVYFDPRSGRPVSLMYPQPIIPGTGEGNQVTLADFSPTLGREITEVNAQVVREVVLKHLTKYASLLNINVDEIGEIRATNFVENVWHVNATRKVNDILVRDATISLLINHGNLVLWGLEKWGDIDVSIVPAINKERALEIGYDFVGGKTLTDNFLRRPRLELIPVAPDWDGAVGKGYSYKLVWAYTFARDGFVNKWETLVDAHSGRVLSFLDTNLYATKKIVGAIYPVSDDECCPDGCAVTGVPAPYTNTGMTTPNDYTDFGGLYDYSSGTAVTTLDGRYVQMGTDNCGTISESSATGDIDMGGTNGQHNCTVPSGHSAGDTFSSRSCAIETTYMNRQVRSWLNMAWLDSFIVCNVNINSSCNAYFSGNSINFYRSGGGCRNTGEIAAVFDHEWGHAVDTHDAQPSISAPGEAIADIAASVRLHESCIGRGFFWTLDRGCGQWTNCPTNPGTSYGYNCSGYNAAECCLNCTGIRQIDYVQHADPDADTPANYTCTICGASSGTPCGKETHCEGIPPAEVGWDLAARDLQAAPFNMDKQTAFTIADKIIWQGHNNVTSWYTCTCPSTSSGCGANNAYPNWIATEDDDGNVNNGTPHMTAIYAAHNRHGMACATPTPQNSGCSGAPTTAATLTAAPSNNSVALSWNAVTGAANYYVWRTDGPYGCDFGRVKIATVTTTSYTDNQALNGKTYYYNVQAIGSNSDCLGPLSNCVSATPVPCTSCAAYLGGSASIESITGGDSDAYLDNCEGATVQVTIQNIGSSTAANTNVNITSTDSFISISTPMPINVGDIPFGGTVNTTFSFSVGQGVNKAACLEDGTFDISVQSTGQTPAANDAFGFTYEIDILTGNVNWPFETGLDGWTVEGGTWALSTTRVNPGGSTHSVHSSQAVNQNCDMMISPEYEATSTTVLHAPNWYTIEPYSAGYWYDRSNIWVVQSGIETLISPASGKLYVTGTLYDWSSYCNQGTDKYGWAGTGATWGDSVFNLGSYDGEILQLRVKNMTDDLSALEGT